MISSIFKSGFKRLVTLGVFLSLFLWKIEYSSLSAPEGEPSPRMDSIYALPPEEFDVHAQASSLPPMVVSMPSPFPRLGPYIATLEGISGITTRGKEGNISTLRLNYHLNWGDSFVTGPHGIVRLVFDRDNQVLVAPHSYVEVTREEPIVDPAYPEVPVFKIYSGEARFLIRTQHHVLGNGINVSPYQFYVSIPSAYLGVRGTDFIVSVKEEMSEIRTFNGVVHVASNPIALKKQVIESVSAGKFTVSYLKSRKIEKAKLFLMSPFLKEFHHKYPVLEEVHRTAIRESKAGLTKIRFEMK